MGVGSKLRSLVGLLRRREIIPVYYSIPPNELLGDKIALIIGGSGGIGKAIAECFLDCGCNVIITSTTEQKLIGAIASFSDYEAERIGGVVWDVSAVDAMSANLRKALEVFGRIDIMVNASGVHTENASLWKMTPEEFERIMRINLEGAYFSAIETARYMRAANIRGKILIVSSSRGLEPAWSPYGVSKWGLNGMIKGLAQEFFQYGIVLNGIAPGSTATSLLGVGDGESISSEENLAHRMATPKEVASFAAYLVSNAADMVVGEILSISAGRGVFDIR